MSVRLDKVLRGALKTQYGRAVGGSQEFDSWPLLVKERARDDPRSFQSSSSRLTLKAATGGTTGLPLQLTRSLSQ